MHIWFKANFDLRKNYFVGWAFWLCLWFFSNLSWFTFDAIYIRLWAFGWCGRESSKSFMGQWFGWELGVRYEFQMISWKIWIICRIWLRRWSIDKNHSRDQSPDFCTTSDILAMRHSRTSELITIRNQWLNRFRLKVIHTWSTNTHCRSLNDQFGWNNGTSIGLNNRQLTMNTQRCVTGGCWRRIIINSNCWYSPGNASIDGFGCWLEWSRNPSKSIVSENVIQ